MHHCKKTIVPDSNMHSFSIQVQMTERETVVALADMFSVHIVTVGSNCGHWECKKSHSKSLKQLTSFPKGHKRDSSEVSVCSCYVTLSPHTAIFTVSVWPSPEAAGTVELRLLKAQQSDQIKEKASVYSVFLRERWRETVDTCEQTLPHVYSDLLIVRKPRIWDLNKHRL